MRVHTDTIEQFTASEVPKEAMLYEKEELAAVTCNLCAHRCYVPAGHEGICKVGENRAGVLYTLVYDRVISANIDPAEKKPLFLFLPGTEAYPLALEVTALVVPGHNDTDEELCQIARFSKDVDPEMPWHLSASFPAYKMMETEPTDRQPLLRAWRIGKDAGLHHVYCGNLPALHEDTVCYRCNKTWIRRVGFNAESNRLDRGRCLSCRTAIHGVWGRQASRAVTRAQIN